MNLPLCAVEFLRECVRLYKKQSVHKATIILSVSTTLAECIGMLTVKLMHIPSASILGEIGLVLNPTQLLENLRSVCKATLEITGLIYCTYSLKWMPLFVLAAILFFFVIHAICRIIKCRDFCPLALCIFYCCISLTAVVTVGIFIMQIRQIYLFPYYLLVAFSIIYLHETNLIASKSSNSTLKLRIFLACLCMLGTVNFIFNFVPCTNQAHADELYSKIESRIEQDGIDKIWVFLTTSPTVAMYSEDKIIAGTIRLNREWQEGEPSNLVIPNGYLSAKSMYETENEYIYLLSSNWDHDTYFKRFNPRQVTFFLEQCQIVEKYSSRDLNFTLYKVPKNILDLSYFNN